MSYEKTIRRLKVEDIHIQDTPRGVQELVFSTDDGELKGLFHPTETAEAAILWLGGVGGGFDGPARGLFARLARKLVPDGVASLRLDWRYRTDLDECVMDALVGVHYLHTDGGFERIVLVGHSMGGAVAIQAGIVRHETRGVAALSSQTFGTNGVHRLAPRKPLLLLHGTSDQVLPDICSRDIYDRAGHPKSIRLYEGCDHVLEGCASLVERDLEQWLRDVLEVDIGVREEL